MHDGWVVAVIDCTGHGVPGAFMTMLVSALLNRIMDTEPDVSPDCILLELHRLVQENLRACHDMDHVENGLDMALCRYRKGRQVLEFAGAGLPLTCLRDGQIQRIEGSKLRIGFKERSRQKEGCNKAAVTLHQIECSQGMQCYLYSDGVLDLPGGKKGFGLGKSGFETLLAQVCHLPMAQQSKEFTKQFERYLGDYSPKDDMILLGFLL
jgi:serine phosphatase RsbU (regulator of sigma subunit)